MSRAFYLNLAVDNLKKNARTIIPYILTSVLTTMMLYMVVSLANNPHLNEIVGGASIKQLLGFGTVIIEIFAFIFLFYTHSFLIKRRQKEFALFSILGMEKKHLARVLFYETLITLLVSLILGIGLGVLLDKAMFLVIAKMIGADIILGFYFSFIGMRQCVLVIGLIYVLIYFYSMIRIHISSPIELLHSDHMGEKEPKAKWFLSIIGILCLGIGYYLSITTKNPLSALYVFFVAVVLVIIGTYLLFTSISVTFLKLMKKNKNYYYKTNHFISISGMMYRMKQNAVGLANICILSTMVLVMLSSTLSMWSSIDRVVDSQNPRDFIGTGYGEAANIDFDEMSEELIRMGIVPKNLLAYKELGYAGYLKNGTLITDYRDEGINAVNEIQEFYCLPLKDIQDYENIKGSLKPNEIYVYSNVEKVKEKTLSLFGKEYVVKKQLDHLKMDKNNPNVTEHYYIIVDSEKTLETMQEDQTNVYGDDASTIYASYSFDCDANDRRVIEKLTQNGNINNFIWTNKSDQKQGLIELYAGILFIGIFLSFLFIMATILIMYYKQITEGYEDKDRFEIMQKVGLEQSDVKKAIHSQVLTVFFMPLLVAGLHVCFAYPMIKKLLHLLFVSDSWLYVRTTSMCFVAFALVYIVIYVLTSKVYYGIVKRNA